ncbi:hypothetical protein UP09_33470 [Bradyrhizobium sp. LTSP885]|nr:hypothetical protein UP09_33470 [Bradyrhizobium sp. LTSP885]
MGRRRVTHENFFIAKFCDSASAPARFSAAASTHDDDDRASIDEMRIQQMPLALAFPAMLTNADVGGGCTFYIVARTRRRIVRRRARHRGASLRQHFLKRDAVFFDVLVYSGWVCISIPECTQRSRAISHILEGNMAKKAKKAKKAKSAVKKTAKKTRKVAKKKK